MSKLCAKGRYRTGREQGDASKGQRSKRVCMYANIYIHTHTHTHTHTYIYIYIPINLYKYIEERRGIRKQGL